MDLRNRRNVLRELIDDGKPTISTHVHSIWPGIAEVIGHAGTMDYIEFTGQYAPWDLLTLENFGRAIDLFPNMSSMMKLDQEPRTFQAERAVGSGIQNLLFADVRTVQDAEECVAAVRAEHPDTGGIAGVKSTRDMGYVYPNVTLQDYVEETKKIGRGDNDREKDGCREPGSYPRRARYRYGPVRSGGLLYEHRKSRRLSAPRGGSSRKIYY